MFTTLRNIIGIIFPVVAIIVSLAVILRKRKENSPKQFLLSGIIIAVSSYIIYMLVFLIPLEYYLLPLDSPEEVIEYTYGNCEILETIEDENTAFVVFKTNSIQYASIKKDNGKWRVQCPVYLPKAQNAIVHTEEGGLFLNQILSQDNTKKFIAIEDSAFLHDLIVKNISDNINSTFSKLYIPPDLNTSETIIYYTVIDTDTSDYQLTINEKTIKL